MTRIKEWLSLKIVKSPKLVVILIIIVANMAFISIAAFIISISAPPSLESTDYWSCVYYAVTMLLSGYMEIVVEDIGQTGAFIVLFCVLTVILGMVVFTGAVIGYMTDLISSFIENADSNSKKLKISNHIVILNWNNRAAEIINEYLYKKVREKIVVLANKNRDEILEDIYERLSYTLEEENEATRNLSINKRYFERKRYIRKNKLKNKLVIVVREGESWSDMQLNNISIKHAKSIIILNVEPDTQNSLEKTGKGNILTIKTLLQVAQLSAEEDSLSNQKIVVEVEDDRTLDLVNSIVDHKLKSGDDSIVPIAVNRVLGQVFSQITIMPELNTVFDTLFSNKSASLFSLPNESTLITEDEFVSEYLKNHLKAVPLTVMTDEIGHSSSYYMSNSEENINEADKVTLSTTFNVSVSPDYSINDRHILIMGHNSKSPAIMEGFSSFSGEWKKKDGTEILDITVIDNDSYLSEQDYYKQYPFVREVLVADIFEKDLICSEIDKFFSSYSEDGCILILSDDSVSEEETDADALTYLILVQEIVNKRFNSDVNFKLSNTNMIIEILNPRNYDIVSNYSSYNVVISNRYISKIIAQLGEKETLFDLYYDILTYDDPEDNEVLSKEIYIKKVSDFYNEIPEACTAADLIRATYNASTRDNKTIVLGYIKSCGEIIVFGGNQSEIFITFEEDDKLIVFSNH